MNIQKLRFSLFFICVFTFCVNTAQAKYEYKFDDRIYPYGNYDAEVSQKLTRGFTNIMYGWTELVKTPIRMSEGPRNHVVTGVLLGVPYGILRAVGRTLVGAYEVVTFYVPQQPIFESIGGDVL